jgi:hypothetical protein
MSPNTISGKYLILVVESVVLAGVQEWEIDENADRLDGTTGADGGFENDDMGVYSAEMRAQLVQNLASGIYHEIAMGTILTNVRAYRSVFDNQPAFYFPIMRVYNSRNGGRVRDRFTTNIVARSNGPYTRNNPGAG